VTRTLLESIQTIVRDELGRVRTAELAKVQELHPHADDGDTDNYACTVALRDSGIVLSHVPVATGRIGSVSIPAVGELVLVQFLGGNINAPVITGRLYNDEDRPPVSDDGKAVIHLPLGAADDEAVHVELVSADARSLEITLGKSLKLALKDDDPVVSLDVGDGKAKLTIASDGATSVNAKDALSLKGDADISVEAGGKLTLKGSTVEIN
jgi:phage baseplate assembly protein gpV